MKKQIIFILLLNFAFSQTDSLWTEVSGDTVTIHHDNTERNCGSLYDFNVIFLDSNIIEITEVDTGDMAFCNCEFDLELMIGGLSVGTWTAEIYGQDLDNNGETEYYGSVEFTIGTQGGTELVVNGYQSPCNNMSNSLWTEVSGDTVTIHHDNTERNCGVLFDFSLTFLDSNNIEVTEVDTGGVADCFCEFDLELMIGGLSTGTWTAEIYGQDLDNNGETEYFGSVEFTIDAQGGVEFIVSGYQSPCNATSDALAFFPMHIGDMWQYQVSNPNVTFYLTYQIIGDTIMPNGEKYFVKKQDVGNYTQYLRIDTSSSNVLYYDTQSCTTNSEMLAYPLIPYNDTTTTVVDCENSSFQLSYIDLTHLFIDTWIWYIEEELTFENGIGLVYLYGVEGTEYYQLLTGAVIDGITYGELVGIEEENPVVQNFKLFRPYPNPFNPTTTIQFNVDARHASQLLIYDITGRLVETLINEPLTPGDHEIKWNAGHLPSGIYFVRLQSGNYSDVQKLILLK